MNSLETLDCVLRQDGRSIVGRCRLWQDIDVRDERSSYRGEFWGEGDLSLPALLALSDGSGADLELADGRAARVLFTTLTSRVEAGRRVLFGAFTADGVPIGTHAD